MDRKIRPREEESTDPCSASKRTSTSRRYDTTSSFRGREEESTDPRSASKIQRMSTSRRYGKILLLCICAPDTNQSGFSYGPNDIDHSLYVFDLDDEGNCSSDAPNTPRYPDLYLGALGLGFNSLCLFGSTLYLFADGKTEVFAHKLTLPSSSSSSTEPSVLTENEIIDTECPMKFAKVLLVACPTPNGKMLAFSGVLSAKEGNFELFVPDDGGIRGEWMVLPDLVPALRKSREKAGKKLSGFVNVQSYSFIDNGPVLLITTKMGNFTLNIDDPIGWSPWREEEVVRVPRTIDGTCMLVRDGLCFKDWFAWQVGDSPNRLLSYPDLSTARHCRVYGSGVTWLQSEPDCFCVARNLIEQDGTTIRLIIDVCNFDSVVKSNKENIPVDGGKMVVPGVKVVKRLQFLVDPQFKDMCDHYFMCSIESIPPEQV